MQTYAYQLKTKIFTKGDLEFTRIWNSLPSDIKNAQTFNTFKRVIKLFLRARQGTT